uniref:AlNc14C73G4963 protein n=1 Tax=Albugo laibachii Nc14 TaxID=890382 RepID=F0WEA6_9STRA|nr:AlNc14C73G4963 [Albugo laibachii Nc14]|eukprot:CCA19537.1 AlNc14C73G4963 [Albugo laibachii Nc14]
MWNVDHHGYFINLGCWCKLATRASNIKRGRIDTKGFKFVLFKHETWAFKVRMRSKTGTLGQPWHLLQLSRRDPMVTMPVFFLFSSN